MLYGVSFSIWKARLAWLLSVLLSPFVLVPFFSAFLIYEVTTGGWGFLKFYLLCFACSIGVPAAYIGYNVYAGKITDMHVKVLEQRRGPFRAGVAGLAIQVFGLYLAGAPRILVVYAFAIFVSGFAFAQISERWKISVHTGTLGALLAGALVVLGWSPYWLLLQIPLVWARAHRKRHHPWQGFWGGILGFFPTWLCLLIL